MPSKNEQVKSKKAKGKKQEFLYHEDHACPEPVEWEGTRRYFQLRFTIYYLLLFLAFICVNLRLTSSRFSVPFVVNQNQCSLSSPSAKLRIEGLAETPPCKG